VIAPFNRNYRMALTIAMPYLVWTIPYTCLTSESRKMFILCLGSMKGAGRELPPCTEEWWLIASQAIEQAMPLRRCKIKRGGPVWGRSMRHAAKDSMGSDTELLGLDTVKAQRIV
jgi:hypothetical protein